MKSQEALAKIVQGVLKFQNEIFPLQREQFAALKHRQEPVAMFFTCADARILPNVVMQTGPGEVFTERTPGNIVPKYSEHVGGVTASVEYAIMVLHVPLLIICGHTDCGLIKALAEPEPPPAMPALQSWMRHASGARERLLREAANLPMNDKIKRLTEYNVLTQIENLKTHPTVASGLSSGELDVRGWVYDIGEGTIRAAEPGSERFEILRRAPLD